MTISVNELAQEIRRVNGRHELGAGVLAEVLMPFITVRLREPAGVGGECPHEWQDYGQMNVVRCCKCEARAVTGYEERPFTAPQPPAESQARPEKPAECADGCPALTVCDHCQWPPGPDAETQAQGGGEVVAWVSRHDAMFTDAGNWRYTNPVLCSSQESPDMVPLYTAPPSAPAGVEGFSEESAAAIIALNRATAAANALAQQPASDGGFTAADMMVARQEGRKEAQQPPSAPVGASLVQTALRNLPQYISKSGLVGPDKHAAMQCFETLRDALGRPPAEAQAQGGGEVVWPMTEAEVRQWIGACNHEPARQVLRDYLQLRTAPPSAPVGAAEDMVLDAIERRGSSAPVGVEAAADVLHKLRRLALVIREHGTCAPLALDHIGDDLERVLAQQPAAVDGAVDFEIHAGGEYFASIGGPRERAWKEAMHYVSTLHPDDGEPEVFEVTRRKVDIAAQPGGSDNDR